MVQLSRKVTVVKLSVVIMFDFYRGKYRSQGVEQHKQTPYENDPDSAQQPSDPRCSICVHLTKNRR